MPRKLSVVEETERILNRHPEAMARIKAFAKAHERKQRRIKATSSRSSQKAASSES